MSWQADDPHVQAALTQPCEVCKAKPGQPCRNTIQGGAPLAGRAVHFGRAVIAA